MAIEALIEYEDFKRMREAFAAETRNDSTLSTNAEFVAEQVYTRKLEEEDKRGEDFYDRMAAVAIDIASAEMKYLPDDMPYQEKLGVVEERARKNLELYASNKFRANTPTNINMGRWKPQYDFDGNSLGYTIGSQMGSACFVIPIEDTFGESVESLGGGLIEAMNTQQQLHKHGGGTGFSIARLRPAGSIVGYDPVLDGMSSVDWSQNRGVSSGPTSFLIHYLNDPTEAVKQGNTRRGANMGIQRIDHMDFLNHMYAKVGTGLRNESKVKNFNLSMGVTDEFMEAAVNGDTYTLYNPHRADPKIKNILEKKHRIENPELVRKGDVATREQFETILEKNAKNPFNPVTTPSMYLDGDGKTVVNAYTGRDIGFVVNGVVHIDARTVLKEHARLAHSNGEPGMIFLDRMNQYNPVLFHKEIEATNPCGEQPLIDDEACNLGSINAGEFVRYARFESNSQMDLEKRILADPTTNVVSRPDGSVEVMYYDWDGLKETIHDSARFLDGVIDRSEFPAKKVAKAVEDTRKIGLGYMGVADAMILLKKKYGSKESLEFAEALAKTLYEETFKASEEMGKEKGVFPLWEESFYNPDSKLSQWKREHPKEILDRFRGVRKLSDLIKETYPMNLTGRLRNACRTTQAPTGTIRRTTGQKYLGFDNLQISSGIEPLFALHTEDNILNTVVVDDSLAVVKILEREGLDSKGIKEIMEAIKKNRGSARAYGYTPESVANTLDKIPEDVREVLVTAAGGEGVDYEIVKEQHAAMLTRFQRWNDSAISKTMNLPENSKVEDMESFWIDLWKSGAKGGTVYVDGSRSFQILNTGGGKEKISQGQEPKFRRSLTQKAFTVELPYIDSRNASNGDRGQVQRDPGSIFTTVTYDERSSGARLTGVFQSLAEVNPEILSGIGSRNIELSRSLKGGRKLSEIIKDFERQKVSGAQRGVISDEGIMQVNGTSNQDIKHQVEGGTSTEALLSSLYMVNFLTDGGKDFEGSDLEARWDSYREGKVTLRSIINTGGQLELKDKEGERPSLLGSERVIQPGIGVPKSLCPECD